MMYNETRGAKFDKSLTVKNIAKLLRAGIRQAVAEGLLPADCKASVRCERGTAVNIELDFAGGWEVVPECEARRGEYWGRSHVVQLTDEAEAALDLVKGLAAQYNRDASDVQTDYFDVHFYCHVTIARQSYCLLPSDLAGMEPAAAAVFVEAYYKSGDAGEALRVVELVLAKPVAADAAEVEAVPAEPVAVRDLSVSARLARALEELEALPVTGAALPVSEYVANFEFLTDEVEFLRRLLLAETPAA